MGKKGKIAHYRETLDKTLASDNLTDQKKLQARVKDQILRSSEGKTQDYIDNVLEKRTAEVSNFLEMLRSAATDNAPPDTLHQASWKLKQDTEEFRVMYREGPVGSPFHSLLVEGYIDAPLDVCLCVSWETALYPRWFPDMLIPTFKVVAAKSLQKVMIGEEISLVRTKLSWPMSSREAILHSFEFEYLEDGLIVVLLNTIPDLDGIQVETHGFTNEGIPEAGNTVRIDLVGGFALQRVTESRSYFRTIGNMDIKLDFVPPSLINFISRQLIGSGFRFYQKTVASVSKGDEAFAKVLSGPLYSRIREASLSNTEARNLTTQNINGCSTINNGKQKADLQDLQDAPREDYEKVLTSSHAKESADGCESTHHGIQEETHEKTTKKLKNVLGDMFKVGDEPILSNGNANGYSLQHKTATEIEEEEIERTESVAHNRKLNIDIPIKSGRSSVDELQSVHLPKTVPISPQVEKALGTLDKMINVVREARLRAQDSDQPVPGIDANEVTSATTRKHLECTDEQGSSVQQNVTDTPHVLRSGIASNGLRSTDQELHAQLADPGVTLVSPVQNPPIGSWSRNAISAGNSPAVVDSSVNLEVDGLHENNKKTGHQRKWKLCCLHIVSGRIVIQ